jgi:PEP-CTERM motif
VCVVPAMLFKDVFVRKILWTVVAVIGLAALAAPPAHAGATCKIVPSFCPPPPAGGGGGGTQSVPEPATLGVLAAGVAAALAARRRRNKK